MAYWRRAAGSTTGVYP